MRFTRTTSLATFALASSLSLSACVEGVLGPVYVSDGESRREATTVNGGVHVGNNAKVGEAATVNGSVDIGKNSIADEVKSVNGRIRIGSNAKVLHDVGTINGSIHLDSGADVSGDVTNINGSIRLTASHVGGGLSSINADIDVGAGSHVEQGIHVHADSSNVDFDQSRPRVVIGPGATVNGTLRFEREVMLYVSDTATIGPVEGATPIRFSGERPQEGSRTAAATP